MKRTGYLLLSLCLLATPAAFAQAAPTTYEFLTLLENESQSGSQAKLLFAPAFQGKTEVALEGLPGGISSKYLSTHARNLELVNRELEALTAAGWELVHVSGEEHEHEYLFRRPKK